jgi:hypothetical protein
MFKHGCMLIFNCNFYSDRQPFAIRARVHGNQPV